MKRTAIVTSLLLALAAVALAGCMENRPQEVLGDQYKRAGETHTLEENAFLGDVNDVRMVYELENKRDDPVTLTATLRDPGGAVLVSENRTLGPLEKSDWTLRHDFPGDDGPSGLYRADLEVRSGEVEIDNAEMHIDQ